jgi:class 3 adenylate cyclase
MIARIPGWPANLARNRVSLPAMVPVVVALASAILAGLLVDRMAVLANVDGFFRDWEIASFTPAEPQDPNIVIVTITEETLEQFSARSPVDRQFLAELLGTIARHRPRAIGVDILFDQPTEPAKDARLKQTLEKISVPVVLSYLDAPSVVTERQRAFLDSYVPARMRGLATLATDQFDVVRWVYPGAVTRDGSYVPGFARALAAAVGVDAPALLTPMSWHGQPAPNVPAFKEYPAHVVKLLPAEWFTDKIVLIGVSLTLVDRHRTPFMTILSGGEGNLPGVTIQAHGVAQLLNGRQSPAAAWWMDLLVGFGTALVGAGLGMIAKPVPLRFGAGLAFVLILWAAGAAIYNRGGTIIGVIAPTLSLSMAFWTMEALSGRDARRQREFIRGAFSRYVSPDVVDQLIKDPRKLSLEGERRVMTFFFTDVADFTTLAENLDSKDLALVLNAYLDGITEIVQTHGGMVDKFIGDAVFAIFNAPLEQRDHAERAVRCALDCDRFAQAFRAEKNTEGVPFGLTRIGINTGAAVIGNFGSRSRIEYTAQGDAVNTASRLEGLNKYFATRICVSEDTRLLCPHIGFRPVATIVVKGKSKRVDVYEPLTDDDPRKGYLSRYCEAFAQLKEGASDAIELFTLLHAEHPDDTCVAFHLARLRKGERGVIITMAEK